MSWTPHYFDMFYEIFDVGPGGRTYKSSIDQVLSANPSPESCWEYPGSRNAQGYGKAWINGRRQSVHRYALTAAVGPPPSGRPHALHSCDNPPCFNPRHLRWGSPTENMRDKVAAGNHLNVPSGERHGMSKLTQAQVDEIRHRYEVERITQTQLGVDYGISTSTIHLVVRGKIWCQQCWMNSSSTSLRPSSRGGTTLCWWTHLDR